ncbi:hypothetical protein AAEO57_04910 [Flavobacterium sp. DGU38]|uniref:Uncharacterized protein n=1 Tax=Flavobacterium calami TaxID=3139144 RepID=A0ABU9IN31_9FLAO
MKLGIAGNKEEIPAKYDCSFLNKKNNNWVDFQNAEIKLAKQQTFDFEQSVVVKLRTVRSCSQL